MHFSSLVTSTTTASAAALAAIVFLSTAQAQEPPFNLYDRPPPQAGQMVNVMYSTSRHLEIGSEDVAFNTCFTSIHTPNDYAYISFEPKNATINFYSDPTCKEFVFGLNGFYGRNPGPARSYRWVGWTEDAIGFLMDKEPIQGQGIAAPGAEVPPNGHNPGVGGGGTGGEVGGDGAGKNPNHPVPDNTHKGGDNNDSPTSSISSTFFGGVFGTLIVMSIGGVAFWKTVGKKMVEDTKGKGVLPYDRVENPSADRDGDILLRTKNRMDHFELTNDDEDEDEDEDRENDGEDSKAIKANESEHHLLQQQQERRKGRKDSYQDDEDEAHPV
ncbi:hypothetical protein BGX34_009474 [Mortierella sp. NVP85]|nr:hypothetical protein BGX34_009474 [Mortierella sp. NVP85]